MNNGKKHAKNGEEPRSNYSACTLVHITNVQFYIITSKALLAI